MTVRAPHAHGAHLRELTAAGHHDEALAEARALLRSGINDREVMYLYALNLRCLNRLDEALAFLTMFEQAHPEFSRIHQERGHCRLAQRDVAAAICCFETAVAMNDALRDSFRQLALLYTSVGRIAQAQDAERHSSRLASLPPDLVRAASLFADRDLERSEALLRACIDGPARPLVLHLLGNVRRAQGAWLDAQCLLEQALDETPELEALHLDYVRLLIDRQNYAAALSHLEQCPGLRRAQAAHLVFAAVYLGLGRGADAVAALRAAAAARPGAHAWLALGDALRAVGRRDETVDAYHRAAQAGAFAEACWSLANLKNYVFSAPELIRMQEQAASSPRADEREALCFAIGSALNGAGDHRGAWSAFEEGNALHRARHPYDISRDAALIEGLIATCDAEFFAARSGWGVASDDAIFIVGLPRSGSTLVEQILASHPDVDGTRELGELPALVHDLDGRRPDEMRRYPSTLPELTEEDVKRLAGRYLDGTRAYRAAASRFIDKLPNNFLHVALIHLLMPNATIIDVRREPMDCCFSNYQQRYARGHEFSYDLTDLGSYYRLYLRLMRHWDQTLQGRVLTVHYQELLDDLEGQVRRVLAHCRLPYDARCLRFHETERLVATPSSEQVRQPLSRDGIGRWAPYSEWLSPLARALGTAIQRSRRESAAALD
jgi:tetratricopeptide (TPR) repeat protein